MHVQVDCAFDLRTAATGCSNDVTASSATRQRNVIIPPFLSIVDSNPAYAVAPGRPRGVRMTKCGGACRELATSSGHEASPAASDHVQRNTGAGD